MKSNSVIIESKSKIDIEKKFGIEGRDWGLLCITLVIFFEGLYWVFVK